MKTIFFSLITVFILSLTLQAHSEETAFLAMGPGASINNRTIDATDYDYGIDISGDPGLRTLDNISISGAKKGAIRIAGDGVVVKITGGSFNHNVNFGIYIDDQAEVWINGTTISGNGPEVLSTCDDGDRNLCNHGIYVTGKSELYVSNSRFKNNGIAGIWASLDDTYVEIGYTQFIHNAIGYFGALGSHAKIFNSQFYENNKVGNDVVERGARGGRGIWINDYRTQVDIFDTRVRGHRSIGVLNSTRDTPLAESWSIEQNDYSRRSNMKIHGTTKIYENTCGVTDDQGRIQLESVIITKNTTGMSLSLPKDLELTRWPHTGDLNTLILTGDGVLFRNNGETDLIVSGRNKVVADFSKSTIDLSKVYVEAGNDVTINGEIFVPNYVPTQDNNTPTTGDMIGQPVPSNPFAP